MECLTEGPTAFCDVFEWSGMTNMSDARHGDRILVARCAIALLAAGLVLLVTGVLRSPVDSGGEVVPLSVMLGLIAQFVALALGFLGRRRASGKVAMIGAGAILAFVFLFPIFGN